MAKLVSVIGILALALCFASTGSGVYADNGVVFQDAEGEDEDVAEAPKKEAVEKPASLAFLRDFQTRDGTWSEKTGTPDSREGVKAAGSETKCDSEDGTETDAVANTSLALLSFMGEGYDHMSGPFQNTCRLAILYLRRNQTKSGLFSNNIAHHCMAQKAMCELWAVTEHAVIKTLADAGFEALIAAQNDDGGFGDDGKSNAVATTWAVLAFHSSMMAGIEVDEELVKKAYGYVETMRKATVVKYTAEDKHPPQSGNKIKKQPPVCEAGWLICGLFSGELKHDDEDVQKMAKVFIKKGNLPEWKAKNIDLQYYYFTLLALFNVGGETFKTWHKELGRQLLDNQRGFTNADIEAKRDSSKTMLEYGSWDPAGVNGHKYGRVYSTCMAGLCLDIYSRANRMRDPKDKDGPDEKDVEAAAER
ncbi:hypothetical protein OAU50_07375 [Planctomycetota bacterium]|nr:hypothetical protein [Planctomycetota bacterium]